MNSAFISSSSGVPGGEVLPGGDTFQSFNCLSPPPTEGCRASVSAREASQVGPHTFFVYLVPELQLLVSAACQRNEVTNKPEEFNDASYEVNFG